MRIAYYDEEGRPRDAQGLIMDGGIVPDGGVVRVRMAMMDSVQRDIAAGGQADREAALADHLADNGQEQYERRTCDAWRGDGKAPAHRPTIPLSDSAQRQIGAARDHASTVQAHADRFTAQYDAKQAEPDPGGYRAYNERIDSAWKHGRVV